METFALPLALAMNPLSRAVSPKARANRRRHGGLRSSWSRSAANSAESPMVACGRFTPSKVETAKASFSTSASAATRSVRPSDSTPACRDSPLSPGRMRNTGPR